MSTTVVPARRRLSGDDLLELVRRAQVGDDEALDELKLLFRNLDEFWSDFGDVAKSAEDALVTYATGDPFYREAVRQHVGSIKRRLAGARPDPAEHLLAERAAHCWLEVNMAEAMFARTLGAAPTAAAEAQHRWLDRAHRRFLSAIRTLATVQRLRGAFVQVNIGGQHVNVSADQLSLGLGATSGQPPLLDELRTQDKLR
jgi:hypothetical protein